MSKYGMVFVMLPFLLTINSSYSGWSFNPFEWNLNPFTWFQSEKTIRRQKKLEKAQAELEKTVREVAESYGQEIQLFERHTMPSQENEDELRKALKDLQMQLIEHIKCKNTHITHITKGIKFGVEAAQFPYLVYFEKLCNDMKLIRKVHKRYKIKAEENNKSVNKTLMDNANILVLNLTVLMQLISNSDVFIDELGRYSAQYGPVYQRSKVEVQEVCPGTNISLQH